MFKKIILRKSWIDYSSDELRPYCMQNRKEIDYSFIIDDPKKEGSKKLIESFKWILCDMSPVLKEILNDEKNRIKNCREIEIADPNLECVVMYGHSKAVDGTNDLGILLIKAKQYEIKIFEEEVFKLIYTKSNISNTSWVIFFKGARIDYP